MNWGQNKDHSVIMNIVKATKMTKYHFILGNTSDYCPFTNYSLALFYTSRLLKEI